MKIQQKEKEWAAATAPAASAAPQINQTGAEAVDNLEGTKTGAEEEEVAEEDGEKARKIKKRTTTKMDKVNKKSNNHIVTYWGVLK